MLNSHILRLSEGGIPSKLTQDSLLALGTLSQEESATGASPTTAFRLVHVALAILIWCGGIAAAGMTFAGELLRPKSAK